jgi:hypothetical protein
LLVISFSEVLQHLETWHIIPCPSPVHSKDEDNPTEQPRPDRRARLSVTCHHGETSHISRTNLVSIPCDPTPIESYQRDIQRHEEFACGYRPAPATETELRVVDSDSDNVESVLSSCSLISRLCFLVPSRRWVTNSLNSYKGEDLSAWLKQCQQAMRDGEISSWFQRQQQAKRDQDRVNKSVNRLMRKPNFRRKLGVQK